MYRTGDIVKVWSFQSFSGGGFINGKIAIVRQDQTTDNSVLLIVSRKPDNRLVHERFKGLYVLDTTYEVFVGQTEFITRSKKTKRRVESFLEFNSKIRSYECDKLRNSGEKSTNFNYAPEFFIDTNYIIQLNRDLLLYPELFI